MLNRRHIRIKVMQVLYALKNDETQDINDLQKQLEESMENMYDLYLLMLSLLVQIQHRAKNHLRITQQKLLATEADKNPNRKFVNNRLLQLLSDNVQLQQEMKRRKLTQWQTNDEYVDVIFRAILKSDLYKAYMATKDISYREDQEFLIEVYKNIIAPNEKLYDFFEDYCITWLDDLPVVNTRIVKLLRKIGSKSAEHEFLPKLYKDIEDKEFGVDLLQHTFDNKLDYDNEISQKTKNWDKERITKVDLVLLQMAICEFREFSTIPVKVTINEYLEIAKEYSTPKSSIFINGILDKLVKEYTGKGTLNKAGRGLL